MTHEIPEIVIASVHAAERILMTRDPLHDGITHVVSMGSPTEKPPYSFNQISLPRIRITVDDISRPSKIGFLLATTEDVERIIAFFRNIRRPEQAVDKLKILIHCGAGISRSGAAACILATMVMGPGLEFEALRHVYDLPRNDDDKVNPNKHILNLADACLERNGALTRAAYIIWPEHNMPSK